MQGPDRSLSLEKEEGLDFATLLPYMPFPSELSVHWGCLLSKAFLSVRNNMKTE